MGGLEGKRSFKLNANEENPEGVVPREPLTEYWMFEICGSATVAAGARVLALSMARAKVVTVLKDGVVVKSEFERPRVKAAEAVPWERRQKRVNLKNMPPILSESRSPGKGNWRGIFLEELGESLLTRWL
jgi:hypothetical protein